MTEEFVHHADLPHYKPVAQAKRVCVAIESASFMTSPTHPPTYLPIHASVGTARSRRYYNDNGTMTGRSCQAAATFRLMESKKPDEIEHKSLAARVARASAETRFSTLCIKNLSPSVAPLDKLGAAEGQKMQRLSHMARGCSRHFSTHFCCRGEKAPD